MNYFNPDEWTGVIYPVRAKKTERKLVREVENRKKSAQRKFALEMARTQACMGYMSIFNVNAYTKKLRKGDTHPVF